MDIDELRELMHNVPFGNSAFQIEELSKELTPERQYRHALLQVNQKLSAMDECRFRRERLEIDIEEIEEKLKTSEGFTTKRLKVDLEEKSLALDKEIKFIEDCIIEIDIYKKIIKSLPKFTRKEFEIAERGYWKQRLLGDAHMEYLSNGTVGVGTLKALAHIGAEITDKKEIIFKNELKLGQNKD